MVFQQGFTLLTEKTSGFVKVGPDSGVSLNSLIFGFFCFVLFVFFFCVDLLRVHCEDLGHD